MQDYRDREPTLDVKVSVPVTETETIETLEDERPGTPYALLKQSQEQSLTVSRAAEGHEAVAEMLLTLFSSPSRYVPRRVAGDHIADHEALDDRTVDWGAATVTAYPLNDVAPVYLAARRKADQATDSSMVRAGHSVERVLVAWTGGSGFGYPDADDPVEVPDDFQGLARMALFTFCVDQTPGSETVDADDLPDPEDLYEYDRDRGELYA